MAIISSRYLKYLSILILIFSILYKCEIPSDPSNKKAFLLTKNASFQYNRLYIFKIITNIDKYPAWYPNIERVEHIQSTSPKTKTREGEQYRLISKLPLIGDISCALTIQKYDQPKRFIYSINSWLLETHSIELRDNKKNVNATDIEWTVYTKRRSILFQYLFLPFVKFYKNQIVREALFSLMIQIRNL